MSNDTRTALINAINELIDDLDLTDLKQLAQATKFNNLISNLNKYY